VLLTSRVSRLLRSKARRRANIARQQWSGDGETQYLYQVGPSLTFRRVSVAGGASRVHGLLGPFEHDSLLSIDVSPRDEVVFPICHAARVVGRSAALTLAGCEGSFAIRTSGVRSSRGPPNPPYERGLRPGFSLAGWLSPLRPGAWKALSALAAASRSSGCWGGMGASSVSYSQPDLLESSTVPAPFRWWRVSRTANATDHESLVHPPCQIPSPFP